MRRHRVVVDDMHVHDRREVFDRLVAAACTDTLEAPPAPCVRLVLEVPTVAHSLNHYAGRSRWAYRGEKARWFGRLDDAWLLALAERPKVVRQWPRPPQGRVRVTVERITPREGALDPDNAAGSCKPILDALRALALLADDTAASIDLVVRQPKGQPHERRTRITLELLAPAEGKAS